ncbi:MAG: SPASM domain-containing protein [Phycisphaeraceae bacterium]
MMTSQAVALIVTDVERTRFGLRSRVGEQLAGRSVLEQTLRRAARVARVSRLVVVHPTGQRPLELVDARAIARPIEVFAFDPETAADEHWAAARKWAMAAWRGGLGGACGFDEALPAGPLAAALKASGSEAALVLRADWPLFDAGYASAQVAMHLEQPEAYKLTFTQAPPGLAGIVAGQSTLDQLAEHHSSFGQALAYNPRKPRGDAIGREVNQPISAAVRDTYRRFAYDTPRSAALVGAIAEQLGAEFEDADAEAVVAAARQVEAARPEVVRGFLPQQVTLELTPQRPSPGPITPQHYVSLDRAELDPVLAQRIVAQLGDGAGVVGDVALRLGGLGDALLHPAWDEIVRDAHEAGVLGVCVETDLRCGRDALDRLLELPIDAVAVRLNADCGATYRQAMGEDAFKHVTDNLRYLMEQRGRREGAGRRGLPWLVPRLVKTAETMQDMEPFFDRWLLVGAQPVIEPAQSGAGLMPELSPVAMAGPRRVACRQLGGRMTILSDGRVALCDQDWQGRATLGDAREEPLLTIWQRAHEHAEAHACGRFEPAALCGRCSEWHRP